LGSELLPAPRLALNGRPLRCQSWLAYGGAYQLTLWTIVPALALELTQATSATPTATPPSATSNCGPGTTRRRQRPAPRRLCAGARSQAPVSYDHLAALRELVAEHTGEPVSIDIADQALDRVDVA
jgi:hypothetical protein